MTKTLTPVHETPATPADGYVAVRGLIYDQIHKFQRQYGGDRDDLESTAHLAFVKGDTQCRRGTRPNGERIEVPYHTEIRRWVWFEMFDELRTRLRRQEKCRVDAVGEDVDALPDAYFDTDALGHALGDDARYVLGLVLAGPEELHAAAARRGGEPRNLRSCLRAWLQAEGWSTDRINNTFLEIKMAL